MRVSLSHSFQRRRRVRQRGQGGGALGSEGLEFCLELHQCSGALAAIRVLHSACEASAIIAELVGELRQRLEDERRFSAGSPTTRS